MRSNFISILLNLIKKKTKIISTTGFTSRELFQLRSSKNYKFSKDFYMVGGMGHASLALGVSITNKNEIICLRYRAYCNAFRINESNWSYCK